MGTKRTVNNQDALREDEEKVVLALRNALRATRTLTEETSLADMLKQVKHDDEETSHTSQFRWEGIDDAFKLKVAGSEFEDAITSAFFQTHSYKYIDHPTFAKSFRKELTARALPTKEIDAALGYLETLQKEFNRNPGEQDSGWNPNMGDLVDVTTHADDRQHGGHTDPYSGGGQYPENDTYDKGTLEGFE